MIYMQASPNEKEVINGLIEFTLEPIPDQERQTKSSLGSYALSSLEVNKE